MTRTIYRAYLRFQLAYRRTATTRRGVHVGLAPAQRRARVGDTLSRAVLTFQSRPFTRPNDFLMSTFIISEYFFISFQVPKIQSVAIIIVSEAKEGDLDSLTAETYIQTCEVHKKTSYFLNFCILKVLDSLLKSAHFPIIELSKNEL